MIMNKHQHLINALYNNNYHSYSLTITFLSSNYMQEKYNDDVIYQKNSYRYSDATHLHDELAAKLEKITLRIFNKFYCKLLNTSHITRNSFKSSHPIIFYYYETISEDERRLGLQNTSGFINICPVHLHAMVMIPSSVDTSDYIGDDTLKSLHPTLQSSRLTMLNTKADQGQWFSYIRKGADYDSFFGYGSSHPVAFRNNPESFLSSIGIDCPQLTSTTVH
jgi:hypothetical protein